MRHSEKDIRYIRRKGEVPTEQGQQGFRFQCSCLDIQHPERTIAGDRDWDSSRGAKHMGIERNSAKENETPCY